MSSPSLGQSSVRWDGLNFERGDLGEEWIAGETWRPGKIPSLDRVGPNEPIMELGVLTENDAAPSSMGVSRGIRNHEGFEGTRLTRNHGGDLA